MPAGAKNNAVVKKISRNASMGKKIPAGHMVENIGLSGTQIIIHVAGG